MGLGPGMPRPGPRSPAGAVTARGRGVDAHHDVTHPRRDGGRRVLDVDLVARAAGHGGLDEGRVEPEVFGEGHGGLGVADAVDVGQRQARRRPARRAPWRPRARGPCGRAHRWGTRRRRCRRSPRRRAGSDPPGSPWRPPGPIRPSPTQPSAAQAFLGSCAKGVTRSLLGSLGSPSTRSPMMLRWTWSVPP